VVLIQSEENLHTGSPRCEFYVKKPVTDVTDILCAFPMLMTQIENFNTFHHLYAPKKM
jgi:hypothetical protein